MQLLLLTYSTQLGVDIAKCLHVGASIAVFCWNLEAKNGDESLQWLHNSRIETVA